ncbi:MAG: exonuclease subunit SbcD [Bacteroidetes bacterium]|nr:exonuclease subunit SbcD [Bacteroidota bacterium]
MRFLHTSDWHLGQKFLSNDRQEEHRLALNWILETIREKQVDVLLIAGDIFDIGSPPNYAREQYYEFLAKLQATPCRHVVIIGGNHDSPSMLHASREILQFLNIHVVGALSGETSDCLVELKDKEGEVEAVIAAVPFLRDRDVRTASSGESGQERIDQIREGIRNVYAEAAELVKGYAEKNIPLLTMGHLYAAGAKALEEQANIYLGDTVNIKASEFDAVFNYVALGHIHRSQAVGGLEHIRYCGSPIPLSFSEIKDEKQVVLIDFEGDKASIKPVLVPVFRRLKSFSGNLEDVKQRLAEFNGRHEEDPLPAWVEVIIESASLLPGLEQDLYDWTAEMNLELLKIRLVHPRKESQKEPVILDLDDLSPLEVFQRRCESGGEQPEDLDELILTFKNLEDWIREEEGDAA